MTQAPTQPRATAAAPRPGADAVAHYHDGVAKLQAGNVAAAATAFTAAVTAEPAFPEAQNNLGGVLKELGRADDAMAAYRAAIAARADFLPARLNLARLLRERGALDEALALYADSIARHPAEGALYNGFGVTLQMQGGMRAAAEAFEKAVALAPGNSEAHNNLGAALVALKNTGAALVHLQQAIALAPTYADAHRNLGLLLLEEGQPEAAQQRLVVAVGLDPANADAYFDLGMASTRVNDFATAVDAYHTAVQLKPDYAEAWNNLALSCRRQGYLDVALPFYDRAIELAPETPQFASNRLFALGHAPDVDGQALADAYRAWDARYAYHLAPAAPGHANDPDPERRLRVGYVSPDFREHAVAYFIEPLLSAHDHGDVEVYCYAELRREDTFTRRFQAHADHWRVTVGMSDDELAQRIRDDGIDVLVDLAGHTANNRLLTFARKPAPVQAGHMVGLGQTTGLAAIDAIITDAVVTPPGSDPLYSETPCRLPRCFLSFRPRPDWPALTPLPARARGTVTLAAFHNPSRIGDHDIRVWSRVLKALPKARLLLMHEYLAGAGVRDRLSAGFEAEGVADRVAYRGVEDGWLAAMSVYEQVDIALDTWPVTGGTTTCIALWMGLPVVTMATDLVQSRFAASLLEAAGCADLVTDSSDAYVERVVALARDLDGLGEFRAGARARLEASPLFDHTGMARAVEAAYRELWRDWCRRQG